MASETNSDASSVPNNLGLQYRYQCSVCNKFLDANALDAHMLTHTTESGGKTANANSQGSSAQQKLKCQICDATFSTSREHGIHMMAHDIMGADMLLKCHICDIQFKSQNELTEHTKQHSTAELNKQAMPATKPAPPINRPTQCIGAASSNLAKFGLLKCFICATNCTSRQSLARHIMTHSQDGLSPEMTLAAQRHLDNLTTNKCNVCSMKFPSERMLTAHMKRQHPDKLPPSPKNQNVGGVLTMAQGAPQIYRCGVCRKEYQLISQIQEHMKEHLTSIDDCCVIYEPPDVNKPIIPESLPEEAEPEKKRRRCPVCDETFERSHLLKLHMKTVHRAKSKYSIVKPTKN